MPLLQSVAKTLSRKIPALWIALLLFFLLATNILVLWSTNSQSVLFAEWLPSIVGNDEQQVGSHVWRRTREPTPLVEVNDRHPVRELMRLADRKFEQYNTGRSRTFNEAVSKYRQAYGRHPPPGYKEVWTYIQRAAKSQIDCA